MKRSDASRYLNCLLRTRKKMTEVCFLLILQAGLSAQTTTILGMPYPQIVVSPGQVTTLFIQGASTPVPTDKNGVSLVQASKVPLPTSLAGFSATIRQGAAGGYAASLPIFSVRQQGICNPSQQVSACLLTVVTVQMPVDMAVSPNLAVGMAEQTYVTVTDTSNDTWTIYVLLDPVRVHILTQCDATAFGLTYNIAPTNLSPCNPLITHADGTLVSLTHKFRRAVF